MFASSPVVRVRTANAATANAAHEQAADLSSFRGYRRRFAVG